ncbi:MAG: proteasome activator [Actinomycetota bacterium]
MTTRPDHPDEVVVVPPEKTEDEHPGDAVEQPGKVIRIASMVRQLLEEVRRAPLDDASRSRLREIYQTSISELAEVLSPDLREELERLSLPFDESAPSDAELRIAHAQLVGWLEGLFHGIQAMLVAQEMESRQRLEEMRRPSLPSGEEGGRAEGGPYL